MQLEAFSQERWDRHINARASEQPVRKGKAKSAGMRARVTAAQISLKNTDKVGRTLLPGQGGVMTS